MRPHCVRIDPGHSGKLVFIRRNAAVIPLVAKQSDVDSYRLGWQVIRSRDKVVWEKVE
jgi:hypothetical protein